MPTADELLSAATVRDLAACLHRAAPERPLDALRVAPDALAGASFSGRIALVRDAVLADLPDTWDPFAAVLHRALEDPAFTRWMIWPIGEAVAVRALDDGRKRAFDAGMALLADLTPRLTAEAAVRAFLIADRDRALAAMLRWTGHRDEHVRRLATEGSRPRLPWARRVPALLADPACTVPILDALYRDPSEYVRRSVANHLNDVSRADPALAVAVAARWSGRPDDHTPQLVRHALRTLVKQGDPDALALLGFPPPADVVLTGPRLGAATVEDGGALEFAFTVENRDGAPARLAIDYVIHHQRANGTLTPKVFKLTVKTLAPGETLRVERRHSFRPISTRRYYPGEHAIEIQINGVASGRTPFTLLRSRS